MSDVVLPDSWGKCLSELPYDLIEEILLRLPLSAVFRSRRVCKLWHYLTTTPYFIQQWQLRRASLRDPPLGLLLQPSYLSARREFLLCSGEPEVHLSGFSLHFLPGFKIKNTIVVASCYDLLLCCHRDTCQRHYFIVNPITCQWQALPPVLSLHQNVLIGLVCKPASIARAITSGGLQYRVARIPIFDESRTTINIEIFASEDERWCTYAITMAEGVRTRSLQLRGGVACNGSVYWKFLRGGVKVMGLNPFNPNERGIIVIQNHANAQIMESNTCYLGTCGDKLKLCEMSWSQNTCQIIIWELRLDQAEWQMVWAHPATAITVPCRPLAFHPINQDILYLQSAESGGVFCCNLEQMTMKTISHSSPRCGYGIPFLLAWWPTPIPT